MKLRIPPRDEVNPETPLRLDVAAALAFPDGSIKGSSLRAMSAKGLLATERVALKKGSRLVPPKKP